MNNIQKYLIENGVRLETIGVKNYALNKMRALEFLDILFEQSASVLGGDVYCMENGKLSLTFDNWYTEKNVNESEKLFYRRSISQANKYIQNYLNNDTYFAFTFKK